MTAYQYADTIRLCAARSLRAAMTDIAEAFAARTGLGVNGKFGPSVVLEQEIAGGAEADVFAAANMGYPRMLNTAGKSGPVFLFTRNKLCALVKPGLAVDSKSVVDRMLDPSIKLGTSTPNSDPSGDYAFEIFRRIDAIRPGAGAILEQKALRLTGAAISAVPPRGHSVHGWHIDEGRADIFLAYFTSAAEAQDEHPNQQIVALPPALAVGGDYGLTVVKGAPPEANQFARFILSSTGQRILTGFGFEPGSPGAP